MRRCRVRTPRSRRLRAVVEASVRLHSSGPTDRPEVGYGVDRLGQGRPGGRVPDGKPTGPHRRAFLVGSAGLATAGAATWAWFQREAVIDSVPLSPEPPAALIPLRRAFDPRATATLTRLLDLLIPGGDGMPSATAAGVPAYLERAGRVEGLRPLRDELLKLSRHLDRLSRPQSFGDLDAARATQLVLEAQADREPKGRFVAARAMEAALRLGLEGYLGHPHHGGNRDFAAWEALRIPMPRERLAHGGHHRDEP